MMDYTIILPSFSMVTEEIQRKYCGAVVRTVISQEEGWNLLVNGGLPVWILYVHTVPVWIFLWVNR